MAQYRLGVRDPEQSGDIVFWYDQRSHPAAYAAWKLITDYGRDGVTATIQKRENDGHWATVLGDAFISEDSHR